MSLNSTQLIKRISPCLILSAVVLLVTQASISRREIEDLDEAHHVMDGMFFADLIADRPLNNLARYPFDYYRQYPALGLTFWPPFYPLVEGIFFRIYGFDFIASRICIVTFAILLVLSIYILLKARSGPLFALSGASLTLTTPVIAEHCNLIMLEIPTLAMAFLTVVLYRRVVERGLWRGWGEVCMFSLCAVATVYTKQTIVFLFPAILVDVSLNRSELSKNRQTWLSAGLFIALASP